MSGCVAQLFDRHPSPRTPLVAPPQNGVPTPYPHVRPVRYEVNGAVVLTSPTRTTRSSLLQSPAGGRRVRPLSVMKTYTAKPGEIQREWFLVDAEGKTLGRLATQIADRLRGKGKPAYTPHVDTGDFVVVVNAEKIAVTGSKLDTKIYYRHTGYPGGIKQRTLREQLERRPTEVIRKAVKGMLPKNKLAAAQLTKLKVYAGPEHPHAAQAPKELEFS
jgi:large subunit ribosomal protein L13